MPKKYKDPIKFIVQMERDLHKKIIKKTTAQYTRNQFMVDAAEGKLSESKKEGKNG